MGEFIYTPNGFNDDCFGDGDGLLPHPSAAQISDGNDSDERIKPNRFTAPKADTRGHCFLGCEAPLAMPTSSRSICTVSSLSAEKRELCGSITRLLLPTFMLVTNEQLPLNVLHIGHAVGAAHDNGSTSTSRGEHLRCRPLRRHAQTVCTIET